MHPDAAFCWWWPRWSSSRVARASWARPPVLNCLTPNALNLGRTIPGVEVQSELQLRNTSRAPMDVVLEDATLLSDRVVHLAWRRDRNHRAALSADGSGEILRDAHGACAGRALPSASREKRSLRSSARARDFAARLLSIRRRSPVCRRPSRNSPCASRCPASGSRRAGERVGAALDCDDKNPCTLDGWSELGRTHPARTCVSSDPARLPE